MDNRPGLAKTAKIDKGSPATARSSGAERIEPPLGTVAAAVASFT